MLITAIHTAYTNVARYRFSKAILLIVTLLLISCTTGDKPIAQWTQADKGLFDAALDDSAEHALVITRDHQAVLWHLAENRIQAVWTHAVKTNSAIIHVAIAPDASRALTAEHHIFALWQLSTGQSLGYWKMPEIIHDVALATGGTRALIGLQSNQAQWVNLENAKTLQTFTHQDTVNSVAISQDTQLALTGSSDKTAKLWQTTTGELIHQFEHQQAVGHVTLSPNARYAFTSAGQFEAKIWHTESGQCLHELKLRGAFFDRIRPANMSVTAAVFSNDNHILYTASPPRFIRAWSVDTGALLEQWLLPKRLSWRPPGTTILALAINRNRRVLISESSDGMAYATPLYRMH